MRGTSILRFFLIVMVAGLFLPVQTPLQAQTLRKAGAGSPYSAIGPGEPADPLSPFTAGMGLSGVSSWDPYAVNSVNPALWGLSGFSQGSISAGHMSHDVSEGELRTTYQRFTFDHFQVVFPVVRSRFGFSFGFQPVTRSVWSLSRNDSFPFEGFDEEVGVNFNREGSGGINKMELGMGWRPSPYFSIGYAGSLHFASMEREYTTLFGTTRINSLAWRETFTGTSTGHRLGLHFRYAGLLRTNDSVFLGGTLAFPVRFGMDRSLTGLRDVGGNFVEVDLIGENGVRDGVMEIPLEFNLGLTYNPASSVNISIEYLQQYWKQAEFTFNSLQEQYLVDRSKVGLGAQYHPYVTRAGGFFSRFKYSTGISWDSGHLMIDNQNVETLLLHAGIGIIPGATRSSVDLSFHYGFRGTGTESLIRETIWGFRLSLNLAEFMFVQPRFQ